ncbi:MAG: TIGR03620 family F420-dependent LLM class oxidoreductase [Solirubrobacteraceae bacterium]
MELTRFGLWIGRSLGEERHGEAARLAEELGYGALWLGASPRLPQVRSMLEASERIVIATGIVNVWAYDPVVLADEFAAIDADFPGRVLLGIGIGHPESTQEYERPLTKMRAFLDGIAAAARPVPRERMALAALGPKMLDLSHERTLGTHPYFTPPAHTRFARERLGPDALVAPEQAVVIDHGDPEAAAGVAREYAARYLQLSNYTNNLKRFGYTDAAITQGSRELIDELVPQGSAEQVAAAARAHLDAGADHVCVQTLQSGGSTGVPERDWRALAAALIG